MAVYREQSVYGSWGRFLRSFSLLFIVGLISLELHYTLNGFFHLDMWLFCLMLSVLWVWRMAFDYTYSFDGNTLLVEKRSLFFKKVYKYELSDVQRIVVKFRRKFFQRDKLPRYLSLFSTADVNDVHLLIVNKNGKQTGVMIKTTENFFKKMQRNYADKFASSAW